jgi:hypothetical protein
MPKDVSMHLHFDAAFLEAHPTLHLHFHLDQCTSPKAAPLPSDAKFLQITSDWPHDGSTCKVNSANANSICAYGNAVNASGGLSQIMACIYPGACPASVSSSPVGATPGHVVAVGSLAFDPTANYYFPAIPGAACDSSGLTSNCLVIWALYYGCMSWEIRKVNFYGLCASQTDCPSRIATAPIETFCPRQYRLWICPPGPISAECSELNALGEIAASGPRELSFCPKRSTPAAPQWFLDDEQSGKWSLRITTLGGQSRAVLRCHALPQLPLVPALLWETKPCEPYDSNRLVPVSPALLQESRISCVIEPA